MISIFAMEKCNLMLGFVNIFSIEILAVHLSHVWHLDYYIEPHFGVYCVLLLNRDSQ